MQRDLTQIPDFVYNTYMKWLRRVFGYLCSLILLLSLVGIALAISAQVSLTHPNKIENWLSQSNLYTNLSTTITNQAQAAIENNITGGVSISKTVVQQAAQSALPQALLKQYVQEFLNSNYAWLEGKTATPNFRIDLSGAKQEFATKVTDTAVLSHLTNLSTCTPAQTLQLENANPLLLSCLPAGVSPQFETSQVAQQIEDSSAFLSNPVITAKIVSTKGLSEHEPYYKKLSMLPKDYRLALKLPWVLGILIIVSIVGIISCARSKRLGLRRIGIVTLISGVLLVAYKFTTDAIFNKYKGRMFNSVNNGQIQQSLTSFVHYIETELAKINLWFGIVYIVLAAIFLCILILPRNHGHTTRSIGGTKETLQDNISATDRPKRQPSFDTITPNVATVNSRRVPKATHQNLKKHPPSPKPPRLIQ
jgi:hypothetical protein